MASSSSIVASVTSIQVDGCSIKLVILVAQHKLCMENSFGEIIGVLYSAKALSMKFVLFF